MGLLGNNDSTPEAQALAARWDGFLKKIEQRYFEVLEQASAPIDDVINNLQFDTIVINNILQGLKNQTVTQLTEKMEGAVRKMDGEMDATGVSRDFKWRERNKVGILRNWMEVEFQKFEISLFARAARKILENVKAHIDEKKMHRCTQCGAELPIKVFSFMAVNLKCDSCGSVNTYQPDDRIRAMEYYVITQLAEEHAMAEKLRARTDKSAMKEYYKKFYGFLIENIPDKKEFYERDLNERLTNPMFTNFA